MFGFLGMSIKDETPDSGEQALGSTRSTMGHYRCLESTVQ
jgi:hypothetical protein